MYVQYNRLRLEEKFEYFISAIKRNGSNQNAAAEQRGRYVTSLPGKNQTLDSKNPKRRYSLIHSL